MSDPDGVRWQHHSPWDTHTSTASSGICPEPKPFTEMLLRLPGDPCIKISRPSREFSGTLTIYMVVVIMTISQLRLALSQAIRFVHAGLYKDNRFMYGGGLGTVLDGAYYLTQSGGTADKPITIKAAGDGEVVLMGLAVTPSSMLWQRTTIILKALRSATRILRFMLELKVSPDRAGSLSRDAVLKISGLVSTPIIRVQRIFTSLTMSLSADKTQIRLWGGQEIHGVASPAIPALVKSNLRVELRVWPCCRQITLLISMMESTTPPTGLPDGYS